MSNTYTQIQIHAVFAVKHRHGLIQRHWKDRLYKYITGIVQENGHKLIAINGMPDHIHIFIGLRPVQSVSQLLQDVKGASSKWINDNKLCVGRFEWQQGYGAFSYCRSEMQTVIDYIHNQEEHHSKKNFADEYKALLKEFDVSFDERYVFKDPL